MKRIRLYLMTEALTRQCWYRWCFPSEEFRVYLNGRPLDKARYSTGEMFIRLQETMLRSEADNLEVKYYTKPKEEHRRSEIKRQRHNFKFSVEDPGINILKNIYNHLVNSGWSS